MTAIAELDALQTGPRIELFTFDLTPIDPAAGKVYYHPSTERDKHVTFGGITYTSVPMRISGVSVRAGTSPQRPRLSISNLNGVIGSITRQYDDLVNARVERRLTFQQFLDGELEEDPLADVPVAKYVIERKIQALPGFVEFELTSFDLDDVFLPRRIVQPHTCPFMYRDPETCSFAGPPTDLLDLQPGDPGYTGPDTCTKRHSGCEARHGRAGDPLRFGAFPGTRRMKRNS